MQPGARIGNRRLLRQGDESPGRLAARRTDTDIVARHKRLQAGDTCERHARLHQPEAGLTAEIFADVLVHLDLSNDMLLRILLIEAQVTHGTDRHPLVDHMRLANLDSFGAIENDLNGNASLRIGLPGKPATY